MVCEQDKTHHEAAEAVDCSRPAVSNTIKHYEDTGEVETHHGGGRSRAYDQNQMRRLSTLIQSHDNATAAELITLMGPSAPHISEQTMRAYRRQLIFTRRKGHVKPIDKAQHIVERHRWACQHRSDPISQWVFMDESTLVMRHTGDYHWVKRGEVTPSHLAEHLRDAVHVWGAVWDDERTFGQYQGKFKASLYLNILTQHLTPHVPAIQQRTLVQDGHRSHWTAALRAYYANNNLTMLKLPPHSPQFNAIEECWAWIKHHVRHLAPSTLAELQTAMTAACVALPQQIIKQYIKHARENIRAG
jgi:transposase